MNIGYIGLGKMGLNMVLRLREQGHTVVAYNRSEQPRKEAEAQGITTTASVQELIASLPQRKIVWLMVSHSAVDDMLESIIPLLAKGDVVVDGGNSNFKDSIRRGELLQKKGIHFLDAGVSGGPKGSREGACVMVGGTEEAYKIVEPIIKDIAAPRAYAHLGAVGAGHFAKMVHNGIEYGMMQAIAEGFAVLKASPFSYNLTSLAELYNNRSVIESRLVGWLKDGYQAFGEDLKEISSTVAHTGEGEWTVWSAKELNVPVPVIEQSLEFRRKSATTPSYTGKILSALRNQFGGHKAEQ